MADKPGVVDLVAEFNRRIKAIPGGERYVVDPMVVDVGAVAVAVAEAWAADMSENLGKGLRPDGVSLMPKVKDEIGRRRGAGTSIAATISARWSPKLNRLVIAADESTPGTLKRVLRGVPFRPPKNSARVAAVQGNAALIAFMQRAGSTGRSKAWSAKRLASWRDWESRRRAPRQEK